jgi:ATP-dependent DNA helicase RecG
MSLTLKTSIDHLNMVGEKYADKLKSQLKIHTLEDLLFHFPFRYDDLASQKEIRDISPGETVTITGYIINIENIYTRTRKQLQKAVVADQSGSRLNVTWFNQPYLLKTLKPGTQVSLAGTAKFFAGKLTLTAPSYELVKEQTQDFKEQTHTGRLVPIYPETFGVSSKWLRSRIKPILPQFQDLIQDWLPPEVLKEEKLIPITQALQKIHFPEDYQDVTQARRRLAFDELLFLQLTTQERKSAWQQKTLRHKLETTTAEVEEFTRTLPFTLTSDQQKSLQEILQDLNSSLPMNRLLQGDVGSGKTVVAAAMIYAIYKQGKKTILMAPTEVLASQHYKSLTSFLKPLGLRIGLYTGAKKSPGALQDYNVYLGTHALLFQDIPHQEVGLVIIDEQHRFGVSQRGKLLGEKTTPHVLSMTATPIPRTAALTLYGDLALSYILTMPRGRKPVKTWVVPQKKRQDAHHWIDKQISNHNTQVFFIYPLIDLSDSQALANTKAAKEEFAQIQKAFPDRKVGLVHGKLKSKEKQKIMQDFADHKLDILVSTSVIEVGIDVPNASIIVIEGAERFGLAQLHQLRGRVGRGDQQSYCLLFTTSQESESKTRLQAMCKIHSGLELANLDLKLRGPGQLYGTMQSGYQDLKIATFSDQDLINATGRQAIKLFPKLDKFPLLQNKLSDSTITYIQPN